jgi:hypothetical protein
MSETGAGEIRDLRGRVEWFCRTTAHNPRPNESGRWLRDMSTLGHVEADWANGRWAVTPAAAALLPASGGTSVLIGVRRLGLLDQLNESDIAVEVVDQKRQGTNRLAMPDTVYLQADDPGDMVAELQSLGIGYVGRAAERVASQLPGIALDARAGPPSWSADTARLTVTAENGITFEDASPDRNGLYRWKVDNRLRYAYRMGNDWYQTDYATGIFWALAERAEPVMRWRHERTVDGEAIGTVFVDHGAPLPPLQARALVLCSGLVAKFNDLAETARYDNVPRSVAERVARSIRQRLADS